MIELTVRYFAAARERAGRSVETVSLTEPFTVKHLIEVLTAQAPQLAPLMPRLRVAVDQEFAEPSTVLAHGAEVALIPPVAGGSGPLLAVVDRPLQLDEVVRAVSGPEQGGVVTFTGTVRNQTHGRVVLKLEYEAYAPMAVKVMQLISAEAVVKWPLVRLAMVHRVGTLTPGDAAVVIATASPHRHNAFEACQFAIDRLKQDVPIWKKEFFEDGEVWVGLGP